MKSSPFEIYVSHNIFPLDNVEKCRYCISKYFDMITLQSYYYLSVIISGKGIENGFSNETFLQKNHFYYAHDNNCIYLYQIRNDNLYFVYYMNQSKLSIVSYSKNMETNISELDINLNIKIDINTKITINNWLHNVHINLREFNDFYTCLKKFLCLQALS